MDTMDEIRQGKLEPNALPPIQVRRVYNNVFNITHTCFELEESY